MFEDAKQSTGVFPAQHLEAARVLGRLPRHYFQAVGSGTGAIGVFEAVLRLHGDRRFGGAVMPRLHLSQSSPFLPIYQAWRDRSAVDPAASWHRPGEEVYASVLANRNPPYALRGGVRDALAASGGDVYSVGAGSAHAAGMIFADAEGIDLDPAAAVRSEEHTSELQSHVNLVCRLLLEKKKKKKKTHYITKKRNKIKKIIN